MMVESQCIYTSRPPLPNCERMGIKRRLHIQFVKRFGVLFGPNIVPLGSKKDWEILDPNI